MDDPLKDLEDLYGLSRQFAILAVAVLATLPTFMIALWVRFQDTGGALKRELIFLTVFVIFVFTGHYSLDAYLPKEKSPPPGCADERLVLAVVFCTAHDLQRLYGQKPQG